MDQEKAIARLEALMLLAAREADAKHAAVFVPVGRSLSLVTQMGLDQAALDLTYAAWARHERRLQAGVTVRYGRVAVWPIFHMQNLVALVYLDSAPEVFPNDPSREHGHMLAASLTYVTPRTPASTYLACGLSQGDAVHVMETDQLAMLLRAHEGNVAAVARQLGVRRETVYHRAARANLDVDDFRPRPRRLRLRTV